MRISWSLLLFSVLFTSLQVRPPGRKQTANGQQPNTHTQTHTRALRTIWRMIRLRTWFQLRPALSARQSNGHKRPVIEWSRKMAVEICSHCPVQLAKVLRTHQSCSGSGQWTAMYYLSQQRTTAIPIIAGSGSGSSSAPSETIFHLRTLTSNVRRVNWKLKLEFRANISNPISILQHATWPPATGRQCTNGCPTAREIRHN